MTNHRIRLHGILLAAWVAAWIVPGPCFSAQVPESSYSDLHWRLVGPYRSGWATAVAGHPTALTTFYFGSADGGVWMTDDAGATWQPMFENGGSASIGALAIAPSDANVIWIGTGQIQQRWDVVDGDGVYRSTDGGITWNHVGLEDSRHIGDLWVDPADAEVAVVAALGHVFGPGGERGLYRTEDGGAHWTRVLSAGDTTGAADIASAVDVPGVLYASLWQLQRHPWLDYFQPGVGGESGIYRSDDGGRNWSRVAGNGLPEGPLGRIELAVAPERGALRVWASIDKEKGGGLYRSDDGGANWFLVNDDSTLASDYYGWVTADPTDPDTVWAGGQPLRRSTDGGANFTIVRSSPGGDDYHALWIDPADSRRMITGADQGAVVTFNGGRSWSSWYNQPTGQFYRLAVDNEFPYHIYSGQQDSGTVSIASRSDYGQISFRDWHPVGGEERDGDVPDPENPDIVYGAGLGGHISRWDARTGQFRNVSPWPISSYAEDPRKARYRYDWITPLAISAAPPHAMYTAAQVVFRSLDKGESWQTISPDLTGADPDAQDCEGEVTVERATACGFATIFAIAPSPLRDGLVWVGTNNGRVLLTLDGGEEWRDVTPPDLEDWSKVNLIDASGADPETAYVAVDRHRLDDFRPRAYVTHDSGASWREIGSGLPDGAYVNVVRSDPARAGLLYAGTSRGARVSFDDGAHWQSLQLDLPTSGINDLVVHEDDVVIATQGRAIWVLDNVAPLRQAGTEHSGPGPALLQPETALRLRFNQNRDTPLPPEESTGENPPAGAILDYILPPGFNGRVNLEITDADGESVRSFDSEHAEAKPDARVYFADTWLGEPQPLAATPGHHRFVWNLRYAPPPTLESDYSIAAVPDRDTPILPQGAFVLPGTYTVRLSAGSEVRTRALEVVMDPRVNADPDQLAELLRFQRQVAEKLQEVVDLADAMGIEYDVYEPGGGEDANEWQTEVKSIASALTSLSIDVEHVDAPPTAAQRALLAHESTRLQTVQEAWQKEVP